MYSSYWLSVICLFWAWVGKAQTKDIKLPPEQLKAIAQKVCTCFDEKTTSEDKAQKIKAMQMCMGVEMMKGMKEYGYLEELSGFDEGREMGENVGRQIGIELAISCPNFIKFFMEAKGKNPFDDDVPPPLPPMVDKLEEGTLVGIETKGFTFVLLKNDNQEVRRFLWAGKFENAELLQFNLKNYKGKRIRLYYQETPPLYDAKNNNYQKYKSILRLEVLK